jgi:hypothetical protein
MDYPARGAPFLAPRIRRSARFIVAILTACAIILMIFEGVHIHAAFAATRG